MSDRPYFEHGPITIEEGSMEDWYVIVSAARHHDRINPGADIEGTREDMLAIADAIQKSEFASQGRCAVDARGGERVRLWSPRNSMETTSVSRVHAEMLADEIRAKFGTLQNQPPVSTPAEVIRDAVVDATVAEIAALRAETDDMREVLANATAWIEDAPHSLICDHRVPCSCGRYIALASARDTLSRRIISDAAPRESNAAPAPSASTTIPVDPATLQWLVIGFFRYALGRQSYAVSDAISYVRRFVHVLSDHDRHQIVKDIALALQTGGAGAEMDQRAWRELAAWLTERDSRAAEGGG